MTPQKANNHTIEDLVESEEYESTVAEVRRLLRMFTELKKDIQKQLSESQDNTDKNLRRDRNN
jgi:Arc/MetJ-type ribon-helix-helix transcriptional regulator